MKQKTKQVKRSKLLLLAFLFACIGMTTEIFFTAFYEMVQDIRAGKSPDLSLTGKTYVWMFLIYATIPFFLHFLYQPIRHLSIFVKALLGVVLIYIVEFISGWLLEITTGKCPWEYTEGWHVMGYIRLDYALFWYVFALFVIKLYEIMDKRLGGK